MKERKKKKNSRVNDAQSCEKITEQQERIPVSNFFQRLFLFPS